MKNWNQSFAIHCTLYRSLLVVFYLALFHLSNIVELYWIYSSRLEAKLNTIDVSHFYYELKFLQFSFNLEFWWIVVAQKKFYLGVKHVFASEKKYSKQVRYCLWLDQAGLLFKMDELFSIMKFACWAKLLNNIIKNSFYV